MGGGQGGWVTANAMGSDALNPHNADPFGAGGSGMDAPLNFPGGGAGIQPTAPGMPSQEGVEAFFSVEPVGAVALRLNFSEFSLINMSAAVPMEASQGKRPKTPYGSCRRSWSSGCCPEAQGRNPRNERSQIRSETILPTHLMRFL